MADLHIQISSIISERKEARAKEDFFLLEGSSVFLIMWKVQSFIFVRLIYRMTQNRVPVYLFYSPALDARWCTNAYIVPWSFCGNYWTFIVLSSDMISFFVVLCASWCCYSYFYAFYSGISFMMSKIPAFRRCLVNLQILRL